MLDAGTSNYAFFSMHLRRREQRFGHTERLATVVDDYVHRSRAHAGDDEQGKGGKTGASTSGDGVGWGCPRIRCVRDEGEIKTTMRRGVRRAGMRDPGDKSVLGIRGKDCLKYCRHGRR